MIITEISAGFGNQLFQYAAGMSLAIRHNTQLKINIKFNNRDTNRELGLSSLNTKLEIASEEELKKIYPSSPISRAIQNILPFSSIKYFKEKNFSYQTGFERLSSNVYLKGYWQSELYFSLYREHIINAFTLKEEFYTEVSDLLVEVNNTESVAIHVRKGDYLIPPFYDYYIHLESNYYNRAINLLKVQKTNLKFFVFTDDPNWVKKNLDIDEKFTLVSRNLSYTPYQDFKIMQSCKYHIIANSSFSWWSAWLSNHSDKIVIAPKLWFNQGPADTQDLLPAEWIKI